MKETDHPNEKQIVDISKKYQKLYTYKNVELVKSNVLNYMQQYRMYQCNLKLCQTKY